MNPQGKTHYHVLHKFIPVPQAMKVLDAKAAVDKERKKLETSPAWQLDQVKSKSEVNLEASKDQRKVHFATLVDMCHLKTRGLNHNFRSLKDWVVLRGDIEQDDSGAYAVFTEQGLSAPSMTAAKLIDVIA